MKKVVVAFTGIIGVLAATVLLITFVPHLAPADENSPIANVRAASMNALIDASGLKDKAMRAMHDNLDVISTTTGLSEADCAQIIYGLDIKSWEATVLPNAAEEEGTLSGHYAGIDGTVTFYNDPEFVTVDAYGQSVTMRIPESAQAYLPYLQLEQ
ncbi:MAG: hypothetical protein RR547_06025 [Raoultibacter sp.]